MRASHNTSHPGTPQAPGIGSPSPWGQVEHAESVIPGIVWVSTASHGGFWVAPQPNMALLRAGVESLNYYHRDAGWAGWYEEDCLWSLVAVAYPETMRRGPFANTPNALETAAEMAKQVYPDVYAHLVAMSSQLA